MRVLDSQAPGTTRPSIADAPPHHSTACPTRRVAHFERVQAGLDARWASRSGIEPRLVRGLDYYTHTAFEFVSGALDAAQTTIGGGGRYDGLVESLGGPPTPGIGFGSGIERVLLTCDAEGVFAAPDAARRRLRRRRHRRRRAPATSAVELRRAGIAADRAFDGRSMKSQMKSADRSGAALRADRRRATSSPPAPSPSATSAATASSSRSEREPSWPPSRPCSPTLVHRLIRPARRSTAHDAAPSSRGPTVTDSLPDAHRLLRRAPRRRHRSSGSRCAAGSPAAASTASTWPSSTSATTPGSCSAWSTAPPTCAPSTSCASPAPCGPAPRAP